MHEMSLLEGMVVNAASKNSVRREKLEIRYQL